MNEGILIGGSDAGQILLNPRYANRHGLVAGATGTGKTVTLQCLAEGFSDLGIPVFLADVKVAAQSFRTNPNLDTITAITQMGVGEALVSTLQKKGIPAPVERVLIRPPHSRMGRKFFRGILGSLLK